MCCIYECELAYYFAKILVRVQLLGDRNATVTYLECVLELGGLWPANYLEGFVKDVEMSMICFVGLFR